MSGSPVRNLLFVVLLLVAGCGPLERGSSVPRAETVRALPLGLPNARYYADGDPAPLIAEGLAALAREEAVLTSQGVSLRQLPPVRGWARAVSGSGARPERSPSCTCRHTAATGNRRIWVVPCF